MLKRAVFWLIIFVPLLAVAETGSFITLKMLTNIIAFKHRIYIPPEVTEAEFEFYLEDRDPILGWPGEKRVAAEFTATGARPSPANERYSEAPICLSLYGDSYTFSSEVGADDAWGNLLAERLKCRVENYGVPGYGTDQAVLRFINSGDVAPVAILGIYPIDLVRNLNQWHLLTSGPHAPLGFKPVFTERDGQPELVELPKLDFAEYQQLTRDPSLYLHAEHYLPQARGPVVMEFPYTVAILRLTWKVVDSFSVAQIMDNPTDPRQWNWDPWYEQNGSPDGRAISLNALAVRQFHTECEQRQMRCVVLIIPDPASLDRYTVDGAMSLEWIYEPFQDTIEVWDATAYMASNASNGTCAYIGVLNDCVGHYNAAGYALLADYVHQRLATLAAVAN